MDDHSTDPETLEIIRTLSQQDPRIKVIRNETNHGAGYARNLGVDLCQGKYFNFLDHDDILDDKFIERLRQDLIQYNCECAECNFKVFFDKSLAKDDYRRGLIHILNDNYDKTKDTIALQTRELILNYKLLFSVSRVVWDKLFDTEAYRKSGVRFCENCTCEDVDWSIRIHSLLNTFVTDNFIGIHYRIPNNSVTTASKKFFIGIFEAWSKVFDFLWANVNLHQHLPSFRMR